MFTLTVKSTDAAEIFALQNNAAEVAFLRRCATLRDYLKLNRLGATTGATRPERMVIWAAWERAQEIAADNAEVK